MRNNETMFGVIATIALGCLLVLFLPGNGDALPAKVSAEGSVNLTTYSEQQRILDVESFDTIWKTVGDQHWDPALGGVDWDAVRRELRPRIETAASHDEAQEIMMQMLDVLGISHCQLIPEEVYDLLGGDAGSGGRDGWAGITVAIADGSALVRRLEDGSAASLAGVKPGWEILQIGSVVIRDRLKKASEALSDSPWLDVHLHGIVESALEGPVGEPLSVELADEEGQVQKIELTLKQKPGQKFEAGNFPGHYVSVEVRRPHSEVGYIALSQFMAPAYVMPLFNRAIHEFSESKGVILDLRGNGGGMPTMVIGVARWLLPGETRDLGTAITRDTRLRFVVPPRTNAYSGRIAVLIDGRSGSGSEVLAGGLKALDRARIFGTKSAGAVLASSIVTLPNGDCLQYAFADFVDPAGVRLEGVGVQPDVEIHQSKEQLLTGKDPVIEAAVEWLLTS